MVYAQVKNGIIKNVINLDDVSLEPVFLEGFDQLIRIDNLQQQINKYDLYDPDSNIFSSPPVSKNYTKIISQEQSDANNPNRVTGVKVEVDDPSHVIFIAIPADYLKEDIISQYIEKICQIYRDGNYVFGNVSDLIGIKT